MWLKLISLFLFFIPYTWAQAQSLENVLHKLDKVIASRPTYIAEKEKSLEKLKKEVHLMKGVEQFDGYVQIYEEYRTFDTDSAFHYCDVCMQWAQDHNSKEKYQQAQILQAISLSITGSYLEANQLLENIELPIYSENKDLYYSARTDMYAWMAEFSEIAEKRRAYLKLSGDYRDSLFSVTKNSLYKRYTEISLLSRDNLKESINKGLAVYKALPEKHDSIRLVAFLLASSYNQLGVNDSAKYYFAISAISDMERGVREHSSLINLSTKLFKDGEVTRAYHYMNQCLDDAAKCKATLRTLEMSKMMPQIMSAYQKKLEEQQYFLFGGTLLLLMLLVIVAVELMRIYRISQNLNAAQKEAIKANENLKISNQELERALQKEQILSRNLQDSNKIKETYIVEYMRNCSDCIEKMEEYRKMLQQLAMRSTTEKLFSAIKSKDFIEEELETFYKGFDETFLNLFPDFAEQLNTLLVENGRITPPSGKRLNTELRIFALIRLGITDSNDIAAFLRYSVKTIYNYRTKIRNLALGSRDQLEENLKKLGLK